MFCQRRGAEANESAFRADIASLVSFSLSVSVAVSLINNLLQVSVRRRFSVGKALGHAWLQVRDLNLYEWTITDRLGGYLGYCV